MKQEQNSYYGTGKYQPIDIIDYYHMDFNLANALKYVIRAGNKPGEPIMKDMNKAKDYLFNFKKRLKINSCVMYELRDYYSVANNYIENIDFVKDLEESGLHPKALDFVKTVIDFYKDMYYASFSIEDEEFVLYAWDGIEDAFYKYYKYCESISEDPNTTTYHTSDNRTFTLNNK